MRVERKDARHPEIYRYQAVEDDKRCSDEEARFFNAQHPCEEERRPESTDYRQKPQHRPAPSFLMVFIRMLFYWLCQDIQTEADGLNLIDHKD